MSCVFRQKVGGAGGVDGCQCCECVRSRLPVDGIDLIRSGRRCHGGTLLCEVRAWLDHGIEGDDAQCGRHDHAGRWDPDSIHQIPARPRRPGLIQHEAEALDLRL